MNCLLTLRCERSCLAYLAKLNFGHDAEDMIFGFEIIEERPLTDIGSFSDVFNGDVGKATLGEELKGAAEEANTCFRGAAFAAAFADYRRQIIGSKVVVKRVLIVYVTFVHSWL
jgi:hypothetical protein